MKFSASKENHLKAIFHLQHEQGIVTTNALAAALQTRPASVTDMLKKLKEQKLLLYERYKGFRLNNEGKKAAIQVIRKHRLWEYFLVKKLQFGWDEVHEIAEELELTIPTIHSFRNRIKEKLELKNSTELLLHAMQWVRDHVAK